MRKDIEISDSQARTYEIKQLDLRKRKRRAQKTYRGRHRRMQIQEFSLKESCLRMHKSEQTRQALLLFP